MRAQARWLPPQIDLREVESLAAALKVHPPLARVLLRRGYGQPEAARRFLKPSLEDLHDPLLLEGMGKAVARLREAIAGGQEILLYGDYDADGTSAVVILKKAIELAGGRASFHVPHRLKDGYGMRAEVIEQAAATGVKLLISVDTGIRAAKVVVRAKELGIDVIVTDHHLPDAELPPACAVLNPNRPDCGYPEKNLCGAGVAFKLVQALFASLGWPPERLQRMTESFLKLVAISTVADVVPLTGENRILVRHGLEGLRKVSNLGLRALLDVAGFTDGQAPSAAQVAFRIAPRMNAAGRMATASDVIEMFLTEDPSRARELAAQLHDLNQERQQAEAAIVRSILEECEKTPITPGQSALVFRGRGWHRGVVGIVASRLAERFHRPVFVLSEDPETGLAQGSGRSIPRFHLLEAMESMGDLFLQFGGHRQAAGLTLALERIPEFERRLNEYAAARLSPADFRPELEIDAALDFREISDQVVQEIFLLVPFGLGNPPPLFAAGGVEVVSPPTPLKDKHLRVNLRQNGRTLICKAWNFAERAAELERGARLDAVLTFEMDHYALSRGLPGWSAVLKDFRRV